MALLNSSVAFITKPSTLCPLLELSCSQERGSISKGRSSRRGLLSGKEWSSLPKYAQWRCVCVCVCVRGGGLTTALYHPRIRIYSSFTRSRPNAIRDSTAVPASTAHCLQSSWRISLSQWPSLQRRCWYLPHYRHKKNPLSASCHVSTNICVMRRWSYLGGSVITFYRSANRRSSLLRERKGHRVKRQCRPSYC